MKPVLNKIQAILKLIRWPNIILLAINLCITKLFLIDFELIFLSFLFDFTFFKLLFSILIVTAAGYIINDFYDYEIDIINKPDDVVVGNAFTKTQAIFIYFICNILAIFLIIKQHNWLIITFLFTIFLLWLYSYKLKGVPIVGNILVSILTALPLIILVFFYAKNQNLIILYAYLAFGISLIREVVKDMEDLEGDKLLGLKTAPIVWGNSKTSKFLIVFSIFYFVSFIILTISYSDKYLLLFTLLLPIFTYFYWKLLYAESKSDFNYLSKILKLIMLFGIISMIFVK